MIHLLKARPPDYPVYSNESDAISVLAGFPAKLSPRKYPYRSPKGTSDDLAKFRETLERTDKVYLVWFTNVHRPYLYDPDELQSLFQMTIADVRLDGTIYVVTSYELR